MSGNLLLDFEVPALVCNFTCKYWNYEIAKAVFGAIFLDTINKSNINQRL